MATVSIKLASLRPSNLSRVEACPGSRALEALAPKKDTAASVRGTLLHDTLEKIVTALKGGELNFAEVLAAYPWPDDIVTEDRDAVMWYIAEAFKYYHAPAFEILNNKGEVISSHDVDGKPLVLIEHHVGDELEALGLDPKHATVDLAFVWPGVGVVVIDYKTGGSPVDHARRNLQIMAYTYALILKYGGGFGRGVILQQSAGDPDDMATSHVWGTPDFETIADRIKAIDRVSQSPTAWLAPNARRQCMFCPVKTSCPRMMELTAEAANLPEVSLTAFLEPMSPAGRRAFYERMKHAATAAKRISEEIVTLAIGGLEVDGYEVTPPKDSTDWINSAEAVSTLQDLATRMFKDPSKVLSKQGPASIGAIKTALGDTAEVKKVIASLRHSVPPKKAQPKLTYKAT